MKLSEEFKQEKKKAIKDLKRYQSTELISVVVESFYLLGYRDSLKDSLKW